jgi:hypothetical protein
MKRLKEEDATVAENGDSEEVKAEKAALERMIRAEFDTIMETENLTPNEAAMKALNTVRERVSRR